MKVILRLSAPLLLVLTLVVGAVAIVSPGTADGKRYVCPPCGIPCDTLHFDAPGTCPKCGMALVEEGSAAATPSPDRKKVAILLFDGVEILDYTGPYEMFGAANCDVYTVARTKNPVTTYMGMIVTPKYSFADAPQPDVLVVPGGGVTEAVNSAPTLKWVDDITAHTLHTMSVCNGAFILAKAGLLDGLTATTTAGNIDRLAKTFPKTKVVRDRRYVDNGKIITTGGLSAGMDGALHVIAKLFGEGTAQKVALDEEYDWRPDAGFARAALADQEIPNINLEDVGRWDVVRTEGTTTRWEIAVRGASQLSDVELMDRVGKALEMQGSWTRVGGRGVEASARTARSWTFTGRDSKPWSATLKLQSVPGEPHHYTAVVSVARAG